jgi:acetyl-CoA acetyltransferase
MAGMMFPWERAVLSGERSDAPMTSLQKFYWVAFAGAIMFLVGNRANQYYKNLKTKEELAEVLAENRRAMQEALEAGGALIPVGWTPHSIPHQSHPTHSHTPRYHAPPDSPHSAREY